MDNVFHVKNVRFTDQNVPHLPLTPGAATGH